MIDDDGDMMAGVNARSTKAARGSGSARPLYSFIASLLKALLGTGVKSCASLDNLAAGRIRIGACANSVEHTHCFNNNTQSLELGLSPANSCGTTSRSSTALDTYCRRSHRRTNRSGSSPRRSHSAPGAQPPEHSAHSLQHRHVSEVTVKYPRDQARRRNMTLSIGFAFKFAFAAARLYPWRCSCSCRDRSSTHRLSLHTASLSARSSSLSS